MEPAAYHELAEIIKKAEVRNLWLSRCDLNWRKLKSFQKNLDGKHITLESLSLNENKAIEPEGFQHIVQVFQNAEIERLALWDCNLTCESLSSFSEQLGMKSVKISTLQLNKNRSMDPACYNQVAEVAKRAKVDTLWLKDCDLNEEKLHEFQKNLDHKLFRLVLDENKRISPESFKHIVQILLQAGVEKLWLKDCDLTYGKLHAFGSYLDGKLIKLSALELGSNRSMVLQAYGEVPAIIERAKVDNLLLGSCDLNTQKLRVLQKNFSGRYIKIAQLSLGDNKSMEPAAYKEVAEIVNAAGVDKLWLDRCDLNKEKLSSFQKSLGENVKIAQLDLSDNKNMEPAAYTEVAEIVNVAGVDKLWLNRCDLNKEKLSSFQKSLRENTKMELLALNENKTIEPEGFRSIAEIVQKADIQALGLSDCQLTADKLSAFKLHLHGKAVKIAELYLRDNKNMEPAAYEEVAEIVNVAGVDQLWLNRCDLNKEKLSSFQKSLRKNTKMEVLALNENKTIEPEGFQYIAEIFQKADIRVLLLRDCQLTSDKLSTFKQHLHKKAVKIAQLELTDNKDMKPAAYKEVAEIVNVAGVDNLWLNRCDLNKEKLSSFRESLGENAKMEMLALNENKTIEPEGFKYIAEIFQKCNIRVLRLQDCQLTPEKLSTFKQHLHGKAVKMPYLELNNNKDMGPASYRELAEIMETAKVSRLWLEHCDLDDEKLCAFRSCLTGLQIKIIQLSISNNRGMKPSAYCKIVDIVDEAKVDRLIMDNCNLNGKKLEEFLKNLKQKKVKMITLSLDENRTIECEDFEHIVGILEVANMTRLSLSDCDLTLEKLQAFSFYLTGKNAKVSTLDITKNRRIDPSCKEVQEIVNKAKISTLLSDKDEKQNQSQTTTSRLNMAKATDSGFQESTASCLDVLSSSVQRVSEDRDTADSGIMGSLRGSEDTMSLRTIEKVENWLERQPGTEERYPKEEMIVAEALELGAKCHQPHYTELENLLTSLKEEELSSERLINIFKEQNDGSNTNGTVILAECVAEVLGAELETQQSLSEQTFAFIDKALHDIDDTWRTQLTINCTDAICKIYFAFSKYHEAVDFCERGIQLIKGTETASGICGDLQQNAGFAYASLNDLSTARSYYLQASESYNACAQEGADAQKRVQLLKERMEDVDRAICAQLPVLQSHGIQASVGSSGAVMTTEDCVINFSAGAVTSDTNIYLYLDDNAAHLPRAVIPITPVMRITPCMTLQKNATVKLRTWCTSSGGGKANIYFKKMEESTWKSIDEVALGIQQYFEFEISEFCTYCVATDGNQMDGKDLAIKSCLFYNASGKLTNRIIPDCATMMEKLVKEMKHEMNYISACSRHMKFMVNMGDALKIKLTARPPEKFSFDDGEQTITITDELFRGLAENEEDFLLPDECGGKINFTHLVQHLPKEGGPGKSITHNKDRIVIGSDFPQPTQVITVGTLAMDKAKVTSNKRKCTTSIQGGKCRKVESDRR